MPGSFVVAGMIAGRMLASVSLSIATKPGRAHARRVGLAAIVCLIATMGPAWSQVKSAPSTYFRITSSLLVHNEPLEIDVVVECGWTTRRIPGSSPHFFPVRVPYVYGMRTKGGHGVLLLTPNACGVGQVERVPKDFFPFVLWAENADDLESLTAYTSEAGYRHPTSKLKLEGTRVSTATADEHQAWLKSAPKNLIQAGDDPFDTSVGGTKHRSINLVAGQDPKAARYGAIGCYGLIRLPIPEEVRQRVRDIWPSSRPRFWAPSGWAVNRLGEVESKIVLSPPARFIQVKNGFAGLAHGLLRDNGGGSFYSRGETYGRVGSKPALPAEVLPLEGSPIDAAFSYANKRHGGVREAREKIRVLLTSDAPRGQMYCARWPDAYWLLRQTDGSSVRMTFDIDIGGQVIESKVGPVDSGLGFIIVEEDKYWFYLDSMFLSSESGGLK